MSDAKREIGVNEKLTIGQSLFYGFQSVIALNLFLGAFIIAGMLKLDEASAGALIGMNFLACGIGTFIQANWFVRYPVIQGISFAAIPAIVAVISKLGFATALGSLIPGAILVIILGYLNVFSKLVRLLIPALVSGVLVMVIGTSLMPIVIEGVLHSPGPSPAINFALAGFTFVLVAVLLVISTKKVPFAALIGRGSVLYAIIIATILASFIGSVNLTPVYHAPWVGLPRLFPYGWPEFDLSSSLVFTFIYFIVMLEALGCWVAIGAITGDKLTDRTVDAGIRGEGFGCLIGALIGGFPVTSYSPNCGVIAATKVYSRWAAVGGGAIVIVLSFCPKLMTLIAIVPAPIMLGVLGFMTIMIFMSGVRTIRQFPVTERNTLVVGIPIFVTIAVCFLPPPLVQSFPTVLAYLFSSGMAIGCLAAFLVNVVIPQDKSEAGQSFSELESPAGAG